MNGINLKNNLRFIFNYGQGAILFDRVILLKHCSSYKPGS